MMSDKIEYIKSLQKAFEEFNNSTEVLTNAYRELQKKFEDINFELDKKNKELQKSLDENFRVKNYLNNILESMNSGVVAIDLNGKITIFNRAAEEITGFSGEEVVGKYYKDVLGKSVHHKFTLNYTLISGENIVNREKEIIRKDNKKIPISFSTSYITDKSGNILGAVEIFQDLTDYKKLEKELIKKNTLAALGEMAATVAHEIRNPLGGITGFANLLYRDLKDDEDKARLVKKIIQGVESLNKIVTNLLTYTRDFKLNMQIVKLRDIVDNVVGNIGSMMEQRKLQIEIENNIKDELIELKCDKDLLVQSLYNIMINSIDAVSHIENPKISINVLRKEKEIRQFSHWNMITKTPKSMARPIFIKISDNGIGISKENIEKIFNPFFTTKENGTGLGLAIVKKIINLHNGDILIESKENEGTDIIIKLPGID